MSTIPLKVCPCCGEPARLVWFPVTGRRRRDEHTEYYVACGQAVPCLTNYSPGHGGYTSDGAAADAWNTRAPIIASSEMMQAGHNAARAQLPGRDGLVGYRQLRAAWDAMIAHPDAGLPLL